MTKILKLKLSAIIILSIVLTLCLSVLTVSAVGSGQVDGTYPEVKLDIEDSSIDPLTESINLPISVATGDFNGEGLFGSVITMTADIPIESITLTIPLALQSDWYVSSGPANSFGGMVTYIGSEAGGYTTEDEVFVNALVQFSDTVSGDSVSLDATVENIYGTDSDDLDSAYQVLDTMSLPVQADEITIRLDEISVDQLKGYVSSNTTEVTVNGTPAILGGLGGSQGERVFTMDSIPLDLSAELNTLRKIEIIATDDASNTEALYTLVGKFCGGELPACDPTKTEVNTTDLAYLATEWDKLGPVFANILTVNHGRFINPETGDVEVGLNPTVSSVIATPEMLEGEEGVEFDFDIEVSIIDNLMSIITGDVEIIVIDPNGDEVSTGTNQEIPEMRSGQVYEYDFAITIPVDHSLHGQYNVSVNATDAHGNSTGYTAQNVFEYKSESAIAAPVNLQGVGGDEIVSLTWDEVANATGYNIYKKDGGLTSLNPYALAGNTTTTAFDVKSLKEGETYSFVVTTLVSLEESAYSKAVEVTTLGISVPNGSPVAVDDKTTTVQGTSIEIDVLKNDSDPDGEKLTILSITRPDNGGTVTNLDNKIGYASAETFTGDESFEYTIENESKEQATAKVIVTVNKPE